jgi:predicted DNA-binding helix-hairpin-helix protein
LGFSDLEKLGVVMKRARYFITCQGRFLEKVDNDSLIRQQLTMKNRRNPNRMIPEQLPLFSEI